MPTITSLPEHRVLASDDVTTPKTSAATWILFSIAAIVLLTGVVLFIGYVLRDHDYANATVEPPAAANGTPTPRVSLEVNPSETKNAPNASPTVQSTPATKKEQVSNPAPSPTAGSAKIFTKTEVDQSPRILWRPLPEYTEEARTNNVAGVVVLRAVFSSTGTVSNIHVVSGLPNGLNERAIAAAQQIKFYPAAKDGQLVSMWMELQYNFSLY